MLKLLVMLGFLAAAWPGQAEDNAGTCRVEDRTLPVGAEVVTVFCRTGSSEMPVFSVLVDTLGDSNASARQLSKVWVFSYAPPTLPQRFEALFPIFFPGRHSKDAPQDKAPAPVTDLSRPTHQTWRRAAGLITQVEFFDGQGAMVRAPTRSYTANTLSYKGMKMSEALAALEETGAAIDAGSSGGLSTEEWREVDVRLALNARLLGGLMSDSGLNGAWVRLRGQEGEHRGHNWELLRQRAEANGLYFQPLDFGTFAPTEAMVWVAKPDLETSGASRHFDRKFLGFRNPWTDASLKHWTGYEETWYFDEQGRRCSSEAAGAKPVKMIPLGLYSLTYPRAPLLLVDFRSVARIQSRELAGRMLDYVTLGVFGLTGIANWEYMMGHAAWQWYRQRHGAPTDQVERMNAYAELRLALLTGSGIQPELRDLIVRRIDSMLLSPFGGSVSKEAEFARSQYKALIRSNDTVLEEEIARERGRALVPLEHRKPARFFFTAGTVLTAGLYRHREDVTPARLEGLLRERRTRYLVATLNRIVNSSPNIDTTWDPAIVAQYLDELSDVQGSSVRNGKEISDVIGKVFARTSNEEIRLRCLNCLARMSSPAGREMLSRLRERGDFPASLQSVSGVSAASFSGR